MAAIRTQLRAWPYPINNPAVSSFALDANTDKFGWIFQAEASDTITAVGVLINGITGSSPVYDISIQGVDASTGLPDGVKAASATFTPTAAFTWVTLGTPLEVTVGTRYALVVEYSSGTINASNFANINQWYTGINSREGTVYAVNNTGSWSKTASSLTIFHTFAYRSSTATYGQPFGSISTDAISTNGHRIAVKFSMPSGSCTSYKIRGIEVFGTTPAAGGSVSAGIWDGSGTLLNGVTIDTDTTAAASSTSRSMVFLWDEAAATLSAGTEYYFGVERVDVSVSVQCLNVPENATLGAYMDIAHTLWTYNGTTWSETNTKSPFIKLLVSDITASGSESFTGSKFNRGFN